MVGSVPGLPAALIWKRSARLLALAHKWEGMVRRGEVKDYAEIASATFLCRTIPGIAPGFEAEGE